jgi:hypothetical protein
MAKPTGKPNGRPPHWRTPELLQADVDKYFAVTPIEEQTITGLCLFIGCFRETLLDYGEKDEFFLTVKRAKLKIENAWEMRLVRQGRSADIFALKNFGWKDQQHVDQTTNGRDLPTPICGGVAK